MGMRRETRDTRDTELEDDLRRLLDQELESSGTTRYRLATAARVALPTLTRFMNRERGLSPSAMRRLADALGYDIKLVKKRRKTKRNAQT